MPEHEVMNDDSWFLPSRNIVAGFLRAETIIMQCYENGYLLKPAGLQWHFLVLSGVKNTHKEFAARFSLMTNCFGTTKGTTIESTIQ